MQPAASSALSRPGAAIVLVAAGMTIAYWSVGQKLVHDWSVDDNYSHGFLIVPIALYLTWQRLGRLQAAAARPSWAGLVAIVGGLLMLGAGTLGAELFLARVSIVVVLAGTIVFLGGWPHLRILAFPVGILLLAIPIPAIIFNQIAFPLQLLASEFGATALRILNIPVFREGNIITLANTSLEVAEACSGIRSLMSLLTLSLVYAYFSEHRRGVQVLLIAATIPIAIFTNGLRVAGIGIAASYYGPEAADGFFHTASGWLVFVVAFGTLVVLHNVLRLLIPSPMVRLRGAPEPTA